MIKEYLKSKYPEITESHGELFLVIDKLRLHEVINDLKNDENTKFKMLVDVTAVDYPSRIKRFEAIYNLLSLHKNQRLIIKVELQEGESIKSLVEIYPSANWFEREVFDMYGISFDDHPDMRRILTDYDFEGNPQRKDFPLTGHVEVRYDVEQKKVVYEPVTLTQEFRTFDFESPWEGGIKRENL